MADPALNQAEDPEISASLDIEQLDTNLFRGRRLWLPANARGVFGGQVISQAIVAATNCVKPIYGLHSVHCYFVLNASHAVPILYNVDRVRDGRSYVTRAVRAIQNGRVVFIMLCSFQKPEPWQPSFRPSMPPNIPSPESCEDEDVKLHRLASNPEIEEWRRKRLIQAAIARTESPIAVRKVRQEVQNEIAVFVYWMRAKNIPVSKRETAYQKCILAYMSDIHFIASASAALGLKHASRSDQRGADILGLHSTLDHAIWFYEDNFDCGDWILYEMKTRQVGSGRGLVTGLMFSRNGSPIASISQEGVVRARVYGPDDGATQRSKL